MDIYSPTNFRKNMFSAIKSVKEQKEPIKIVSGNGDNDKGVVVIDTEDYDAMMETIYLLNNGTLATVEKRMKDNSGFTDTDDIDWDNL